VAGADNSIAGFDDVQRGDVALTSQVIDSVTQRVMIRRP